LAGSGNNLRFEGCAVAATPTPGYGSLYLGRLYLMSVHVSTYGLVDTMLLKKANLG
jgi:hypothetical protein